MLDQCDMIVGLSPAFAFSMEVPGVIVVEGDSTRSVIRSTLAYEILRAISGSSTESQIVSALEHVATAPEVMYYLRSLARAGYVEYHDGTAYDQPTSESIFWRSVNRAPSPVSARAVSITSFGIPGSDEFAATLEHAGLRISTTTASLRIILVRDYLDKALYSVNRAALEAGLPWLLVKPVGVNILLGPLFIPGRTACWQCLENRLRGRGLYSNANSEERVLPPFGVVAPAISVASSLIATEVSALLLANKDSVLNGSIIRLDISRMEMKREEIVRRIHCEACGKGLQRSSALSGSQGLQDAARVSTSRRDEVLDFKRHVGEFSGAIRTIERIQVPNMPEAHVYAAAVNHLQRVDVSSAASQAYLVAAAGKGFSAEQAWNSALFEGLERFSAIYEEPVQSVIATAHSLGDAAIWPTRLYSFSDAQFLGRDRWNNIYGRFQPIPEQFDPNEQLAWTAVRTIRGDRARYAPTPFVYFHVPQAMRSPSCISDSNGIAAGQDFQSACIRGLLELIERDAIGIWWYNRIPFPRIKLDSVASQQFQIALNRLMASDREVRAFSIGTDTGIPVLAVASWDHGSFAQRLAMGFGCHPDPEVAAESALCEHNQKLPVIFAESSTMDDGLHLLWNQIDDHDQIALGFLEDDQEISMSDLRSSCTSLEMQTSLLELVRRVNTIQQEIYVADLTKPDVGLSVVRVISPGMSTFWRRTGPGRLYDVPVKMGWRKGPLSESELNPITLVL